MTSTKKEVYLFVDGFDFVASQLVLCEQFDGVLDVRRTDEIVAVEI